ncbi:MAG: adenosine deaminase [Acidimicrobiia bacterium]
MHLHEALRAMPKVSLHVHLEGSIQAATVVDLAAKHDIALPPFSAPEDLYDYPDIYEFLKMYDIAAHAVLDRDDFRRVTYETLQQAHEHGVRYREMFWSPKVHLDAGIAYATAVDGIIDGMRDAERDFGIGCRLIADINRMESAEDGYRMIEVVVANPRPELIGIGLDYAEAGNPPEKFTKAFELAGRNGLRKTAHCCEDGPPQNITTALDVLGVERIDHGYHVLEDPAVVQRCVDDEIVFTCTPVSTAWVYFGDDLANHPIKEMAAKGIKLMLDCDDPPMFGTDPSKDYIVAADHMGFTMPDFKRFVLNGIDGCWIDDATKVAWRREWGAEIDVLAAQID